MQRNYMNSNDVFPILDLIRRERQKVKPQFRDDLGYPVDVDLLPILSEITDWRVVSLSITRDTANPVNNRAIKLIDIEYDVGATAVVELIRGAMPPVVNFGRDTDYLNHVMLRQVRMTTYYNGLEEIMLLTIKKSADYTAIEGVTVEYEGRINTITQSAIPGAVGDLSWGDLDSPVEGDNNSTDVLNVYEPPEQDNDDFYGKRLKNDEVIL